MYDKLSILKIPPNIIKTLTRKNLAKLAKFSAALDGFLSMELYYSLKNPTLCLYSLGWNDSRSALKNITSLSTSEEYSAFTKGFEEKYSVQGEYLIHVYDLEESRTKVVKDTDEKLEKKQKLMDEDSKHTHPLTMPNGILEVVYFKTKSEIELDAFKIDIDKTTSFLKAQPGFIYRKIIRSGNDYLDCVVWKTLKDAENAAQLFIKNSLCQNFIKSIEVLYFDHMIKDFSYLNSTAQNQMKRYVVCDTKPALVDWKTIYNPKQYELSILTDAKSYQKLHKNDQLQYFFYNKQLDSLEYEELRKKFLEIISDLNFRGVGSIQVEILNNDELCMAKCAQLREEFCLLGTSLEKILPFRDKILAKIKLKKIEDKCLPKYIKFDCQEYKKDPENYCDTIAKTLHFPIFAKPIDLAGSVGSCKISDEKELKAWCQKNKDNNYMELDEFIEGRLYHCDSLVLDGKLIKINIAAYLHPCAEFFNNKLCGSIDLLRTDPSWEKFAKFNEMILSELQPPDGVTHLEFFQTADDRLVFVECAARAPGGLIPEMRKNNYGIDINLAQYQLQMKIKTDYASEAKSYSAWAYIPRKYGILKEMIEPKDLSSKVELHWEFKVGEVMQPKDDVGEYAGKILLINDDYEKLRQDFHEIDKHQFFTVQSLTAVKTSYTSSLTGVSKSSTKKSGEKPEENVVQSGSELQHFYRSILTS